MQEGPLATLYQNSFNFASQILEGLFLSANNPL